MAAAQPPVRLHERVGLLRTQKVSKAGFCVRASMLWSLRCERAAVRVVHASRRSVQGAMLQRAMWSVLAGRGRGAAGETAVCTGCVWPPSVVLSSSSSYTLAQ